MQDAVVDIVAPDRENIDPEFIDLTLEVLTWVG
jgi:hypothetical protein